MTDRTTKKQDQNIFDFIITNYGSLEGISDFLKRNNMNSTTEFSSAPVGTKYKVNTDIKNLAIKTFKASDYIVKTGEYNYIFRLNELPTTSIFVGEPLTITWTTNSLKGLKIELYKGATLIEELESYYTDSGQYIFTPVFTLEEGIDYNLKLTKMEDFEIFDITEVFEIKQTVLEVLTPTSTDAYLSGEEFNITWQKNNPYDTANVNINLYYGDGFKVNIAQNVSDLDTYSYNFPLDFDFNTGYYVVVSKVNGNAQGSSDVFELLPTTLTITNPLLNEIYSQGETINIVWTDNNIYDDSNVNIYLLFDGVFESDIALDVADNNSYNYQLPLDITPSLMYSIKVEKVDNNAVFDISEEFQVEALATETIPLTLLRCGEISNSAPFPTVFTSTSGNGLTSQANNTVTAFLLQQPPNIYNQRVFFYSDLGSVTNTVIAGKLYMKIVGDVGVYDNFTTQLSTKSAKIGSYVVFTLNAAGIAALTTKGTQSFCIRNEYDVEIKPVSIDDTSGFTLINSYFELKTT